MAKDGKTPKAEKAPKAPKANVLAWLEQHGSGDSRSVELLFGVSKDGEFEKFHRYSDGQAKLLYGNLKLTAYWSEAGGFSNGNPRYEDISMVERYDAEMMAKTLRQIEAGLRRFDKEWGYSDSFATTALRVCKVLRIKELWRKSKTGRAGKYQVSNVTDLGYVLNTWAEEWKAELHPEPAKDGEKAKA